MRHRALSFLLVLFILSIAVGRTHADTMVDLNDFFFFFPGDPVIVSPAGSMATIGEDADTVACVIGAVGARVVVAHDDALVPEGSEGSVGKVTEVHVSQEKTPRTSAPDVEGTGSVAELLVALVPANGPNGAVWSTPASSNSSSYRSWEVASPHRVLSTSLPHPAICRQPAPLFRPRFPGLPAGKACIRGCR